MVPEQLSTSCLQGVMQPPHLLWGPVVGKARCCERVLHPSALVDTHCECVVVDLSCKRLRHEIKTLRDENRIATRCKRVHHARSLGIIAAYHQTELRGGDLLHLLVKAVRMGVVDSDIWHNVLQALGAPPQRLTTRTHIHLVIATEEDGVWGLVPLFKGLVLLPEALSKLHR